MNPVFKKEKADAPQGRARSGLHVSSGVCVPAQVRHFSDGSQSLAVDGGFGMTCAR